MELPKRLRLWGIGGVGMSALAQHLWHEGHELSGYDREASPQTEILSGLGIPIDFHPNSERLAAAEGVIYTPSHPSRLPGVGSCQAAQLTHLAACSGFSPSAEALPGACRSRGTWENLYQRYPNLAPPCSR